LKLAHALLAAALGAAAAAGLVASCGERVNHVQLVLAPNRAGLVSGFACKEDGGYLVLNAFDAGRLEVSTVVDFFRLRGAPYCRPFDVITYCAEDPRNCVLDLSLRKCLPIDVGGLTAAQIPDAYSAGLADASVLDEAPEGIVIVRAVGTTATCAEVHADKSGAFACEKLVGCASSCPLYLVGSDDGGTVELALDVNGCDLSAVASCASPLLTTLEAGCP
jgi:hypothetical protein